jgi:hypothetical protein
MIAVTHGCGRPSGFSATGRRQAGSTDSWWANTRVRLLLSGDLHFELFSCLVRGVGGSRAEAVIDHEPLPTETSVARPVTDTGRGLDTPGEHDRYKE